MAAPTILEKKTLKPDHVELSDERSVMTGERLISMIIDKIKGGYY